MRRVTAAIVIAVGPVTLGMAPLLRLAPPLGGRLELLVANIDIAQVNHQGGHAQQHREQNRHHDERLPALAVAHDALQKLRFAFSLDALRSLRR